MTWKPFTVDTPAFPGITLIRINGQNVYEVVSIGDPVSGSVIETRRNLRISNYVRVRGITHTSYRMSWIWHPDAWSSGFRIEYALRHCPKETLT